MPVAGTSGSSTSSSSTGSPAPGIRDTFEVIEELRAHGVELVSVSDGFALDGPAAEVVLAVMAWAAKMERLAINERISAARERVEAEGRSWGRPKKMNHREREKMIAMKTSGKSIRKSPWR